MTSVDTPFSAAQVPAFMRALRQDTPRGPRDLRLVTDTRVPVPGDGEVLIRVTAAGVNYADVMQTYGTYGGGPTPPYIAGFEAVGEVVASGGPAAGLRIGDRVLGLGPGAFAEYMVLPSAGTLRVPAGWADEQALGLVLNWATALAALRPLGRLTAGETVWVQAAAGGVGQAAVRLAKHYGARVIGSAAPRKHQVVRDLGADLVVDSGRPDLAAEIGRLTGGEGADLILESTGGAAFRAALAAARRVTGRVVVYGVAGGEATVSNRELNFDHPIHVIGLHLGILVRHAPRLFDQLVDELHALIAAGVIPPGRPTVRDLAEGPRTLAALEARTTVGKTALRP
ncbi:zinc-binding dehydrogenase [Hamadaea tsunoensis]|uniref:zinc-binding dehydrogenase n=1 Tax=Hamadaea tsunoensis TaxID=53368 RepID=UPI000689049A|nr:zinc-binding dehydrogenase [Hamadaea tsunoensis]